MAAGLLTRLHGRVAADQGALTKLRGTASAGQQGALTRLRGACPTTMTVEAGLPQTVNAFDEVTLIAYVLIPAGQVPDSWVWTQTSGTPVTMTSVGPQVTFTAPATLNGDVCGFQVAARIAGLADSPPDTTTVTVNAHGWWSYDLFGNLIGRRFTLGSDL